MASLIMNDGTFLKDRWLLKNDGRLVNELLKCLRTMESLIMNDGTFLKYRWLLENDGNLVNEFLKC